VINKEASCPPPSESARPQTYFHFIFSLTGDDLFVNWLITVNIVGRILSFGWAATLPVMGGDFL